MINNEAQAASAAVSAQVKEPFAESFGRSQGIYAEIDTESDSVSHRRSVIVGGMAGATIGGMLGTALGESYEVLGLTVIGAVLGAVTSRFFTSTKDSDAVRFPTAREVDLYLNATPLIHQYIKNKVSKGLKVEGNLHFLASKEFEEEAFKHTLDRLSKEAKLPQGKTPIKASGLVNQAREVAKRMNAFQTLTSIYINPEKAEAGTVIHESLHLFQEVSYAKRVDIDVNEGTTEYFTRLICAQHQIKRSQKYPLQYESIKKLVTVCGEEKLAAAYFQGNILALEMTVDARKGDGTFHLWTEFIKRQEFSKANKLLVM